MWIYQGKEIKKKEDLPNHELFIGFVYKITNIQTGAIYIGYKLFTKSVKRHFGKKELATVTDKRKKTYERLQKESTWMNYYGSSKEIKADIVTFGRDAFKREILELCCNKKYMSYSELKHIITENALSPGNYNGNLLGRFFTRDLNNCTTIEEP